jgi:hypothetical protein
MMTTIKRREDRFKYSSHSKELIKCSNTVFFFRPPPAFEWWRQVMFGRFRKMPFLDHRNRIGLHSWFLSLDEIQWTLLQCLVGVEYNELVRSEIFLDTELVAAQTQSRISKNCIFVIRFQLVWSNFADAIYFLFDRLSPLKIFFSFFNQLVSFSSLHSTMIFFFFLSVRLSSPFFFIIIYNYFYW